MSLNKKRKPPAHHELAVDKKQTILKRESLIANAYKGNNNILDREIWD